VTNVYHAIADSVNTFFYYIGGGYNDFEGLGVEKLMSYARTFGFASTTGVDLPGEADGFLPSMEWKERVKGERWYIGDTYNVSIGQGDILVTPLQMARATAVFANGGYLVTPQLVHDSDDQGPSIIPADTASEIAAAMRQTVTNGSATSLQSIPVAVAGKTGTAQWSSTRPNHSWFTGFAPYENPELVITVLIEEGGDTGIAIPVTRDILNYWFATSP
jgi:penicillin-binding protein 2